VTLNVGVIGVGMIGQDHIRRLTHVLSGARVAAVTDVDLDRARTVVDDLPGASLHESGQALISDPEVDAVVVTSWGPTHEEYVLACIAAGKQVFCEKPLATTREACERIVDAEVAAGRRLVMVGFMRRYDDQYRFMKQTVTGGGIGRPLLMHAAHRNPSVPSFFTSDMIINDSTVHDIDVARWMFDDEIAAVTVLKPRVSSKAAEGFNDPLLVLLEMTSGVIVDVEASVNAGFAYDIRGEVVCEDGTVELSESAGAIVKRAGQYSGRVPADWRERFVRAFDREFQTWIDAVGAGSSTGPSAWDGYAATVACDAGLAALRSGLRAPVVLRERPDLYKESTTAKGTGA
jgi:myo-inositol 2-dehydrogenase/D-chiro-inositol 1-dehydrogenase